MRRICEGKLEELQDVDDQVVSVLDVLSRTGQLGRTLDLVRSPTTATCSASTGCSARSSPTRSPRASRSSSAARGSRRARRDALVCQVDLMPTTLDVAGLDPDAGRDLDGRSMLGAAQVRRLVRLATTAAGREHRTWTGRCSARATIAYIEHYVPRASGSSTTCDRDPHQLRSIPASSSPRAASEQSQAQSRVTALRSSSGRQLRALET